MSLKLYNTMGKKIEDFIPINKDFVGFYGCGPTVYKAAHIGNLRAYVFQDILSRSLIFLGYDIKHVMNITDIGHLSDDGDNGEDKMLKSARESGLKVSQIADIYIKAFFNDVDSLNIKRPSVVCKATDHIDDMIELIKRIEKNGHTYMAEGNLYFDISTFPNYGKLSGINIETLKPGARIEIDKNKKNPNDFVLWFTKSKFENHALLWDSPWGRGYPGWHIECSAMSIKYLGEQFDIHTGGIDHIRVHHTNEIAQSESATGKKWVNYWLHNEFLITDKGKMSKSEGNVFVLNDIIKAGFNPMDYRFFLLGGHYRKQLAFSWEALETARNARKKLSERINKILADTSKEIIKECENITNSFIFTDYKKYLNNEGCISYLNSFKESIEKDLNTPNAFSYLQLLLKEKNVTSNEILITIAMMDSVLGLNILKEAQALNKTDNNVDNIDIEKIEKLIKMRNQAKIDKDYKKADNIREQLKLENIILEDTSNGTIWKIVDSK
ncbi:MAG: cysteine--tRNA ligase [Treponema sp.]